jgi:hypothetical protein
LLCNALSALITWRFGWSDWVVRGEVESPTFRFSGVADGQLSPATLQYLAAGDSASLALVAHVAVTVAVNKLWTGC